MSKPASTIVRSDAPHMVEVKPGSLNAKSSTAWVDAGEIDPDELIEVVEAKDTPNRQKLGADGPIPDNRQAVPGAAPIVDNRQAVPGSGLIQDNRQAVPGSGPIQDNRQAVAQEALKDNRQPVGEGEAIRDRFAPLPEDTESTHRETLPPSQPMGDNRAALPQDRIQDVRVPLPDTQVNRAQVDLQGPEPVRDDQDPQAVHVAGAVKAVHSKPSEAPLDPVAKAFAHLTLSEQQAAFKSRVAAIRQSVSQINHQLDDLNKE